MNRRKRDVLAWESRWSAPIGLATFVAVVILIISAVVIAGVNGSGEAELLVSAHEHASSVTFSSILEAIGFLILTAPLYFLFRAALSRSSGRMKSQLVGVIVVAPLFFAISGVLNGIATNEAADTYAKGEAKSTLSAEKGTEECRDEEREKSGKEFAEKFSSGASPLKDCEATEQEESAAENALSEASLRDAATGFGLAGRIGLAVARTHGLEAEIGEDVLGRPDRGDAGADHLRLIADQRRISDLHAGNVGDGVERTRRHLPQSDAEIAQARLLHGVPPIPARSGG